jgi:murein DD-endopeptidase MepM/ murein hydrolase activator NlpD
VNVPTRDARRIRRTLPILALLAVLVLPVAAPGAASAADLTSAIASARARQQGLERSMRGLDQVDAGLRRAQSSSRRHAKALRPRIGQAQSRRDAARRRVGTTRMALAKAEDEAAAAREISSAVRREATVALETMAEPLEASTYPGLAPVELQPGPPSVPGAGPGDGEGDAAEAAADDDDRAHVGEEVQPRSLLTPGQAVRAASDAAARVRALRGELRQRERLLRRAQAQVRRLQRAERSAMRRVGGLRREMRANARRRAGTEGALAWQIRATTRLAQMRAAKKTDVRPGSDGSGFAWPVRGRISQGYGCTGFRLEPRRGGCAHFHDGIDIVAPIGTAVRAAAAGVVAYVGWSPQGRPRAFIVVIGHAGGLETLYGHLLPRYPVRAGDVVRRGQVIGFLGNTGRTTGAHLHWEVSRRFVTTNPLAFR